MENSHVQDFKSLDSMDSNLSETTRRHGARNHNRIAPNGQFNPAFGTFIVNKFNNIVLKRTRIEKNLPA